eukprot:CAMPEP_0185280520 /NCGR_PEP_ID=MMETSP1359-20130426/66177_1 /TAXON_ID=552665 /ORGANISM="Bigelowiella longifila, Strain CCMP242" /LENGTH=56 /DNA_ID=CAMNT_0027875789 /DNA_START=648 /DNA_END=818 /DNA_ORIENTATION=-
MAAAGLTVGVPAAAVTGPVGLWAWITSAAAACSVVQGSCMSSCTAVGLLTAAAPTP